jgi:hypothetical protein
MLQSMHHLSVIYPSLYFGCLLFLACVVCPGWYKLGRLQLASVVSPAPTPITPARRRVVFHRRDNAVLLHLGHLAIMGKIESQDDHLALTIALRVT